MARFKGFLFLALIPILIYARPAVAQPGIENPTNQQGVKPYTPYHGGDIDSVSLLNGKLDLHIPLVSWPQRGNLKLGFTIRYDNPRLTEDRDIPGTCGTPGNPCTYWSTFDGGGVQVVPDISYGIYQQPLVDYPNVLIGNAYSIQDATGASHPLGVVSGSRYESVDATAYSWDASTNVVTDRTGIRYYVTSGFLWAPGIPSIVSKAEDTNGNQITYNSGTIIDSMGRNIPLTTTATTDYSGCGGQLPTSSARLWSIPGPNGNQVAYKFCYTTVTLNVMLESGQNHYADTTSHTMLQSIVLPNNTSWTFDYAYGTQGPLTPSGSLVKVTMPTGGTISYNSRKQTTCGSNSIFPHKYEYSITSRTIDPQDSSVPAAWGYVGGVTDPLGNQTIHTFTSLGTSCSLYETQVQYYQGAASANVLLKTVNTDYSWLQTTNMNNNMYTIANVVPIRITTTIPMGSGSRITKVEKDYDTGFTFTDVRGTQWHGIYGNVVADREYDYGSSAPGTLLRRTATNYKAFVTSSYLTYNILDAINSVATYDSIANTCKGVATYCAYSYFGYDEVALSSSGITTQHNASPLNGATRGNQTSAHQWRNTDGTYLNTTRTFFDTGKIVTFTDPRGNPTTFAYSSTYVGAYPTSVTNALNQSMTYAYDFNTGLASSITDLNSKITTKAYDLMSRLTQINFPDGGQQTFSYNDTAPSPSMTETTLVTTATNPVTAVSTTTIMDGLGRTVQTQLATDPEGTDFTDTTYDATGRVWKQTNPHRSATGPTDGTTVYTYDALGRTLTVTQPDGASSTVTTTYSGNTKTVTDEAGKQRKTQTDGLGRLTSVWEDPSGLNYLSNYFYDALDNLTCVEQQGNVTGTGCSAAPSNDATSAWRVRRFTYNSLSQLLNATNRESGSISYTYDNDGSVLTKTAPAPNQPQTGTATAVTTYTYDVLNRLTGKGYTDAYNGNTTPAVTYGYDGVNLSCPSAPLGFTGGAAQNMIGRLSSMCWGTGSQSYIFDAMGRIYTENQRQVGTTNLLSGNIDYRYYLDGHLSTLFMPSSPFIEVYWGETGAGRINTVGDTTNYFLRNATYTPAGALRTATRGPNNLSNIYNSRLQPVTISATNSGGTSILNLTYDFHVGAGDNGNVFKITNGRDNNRTQNFTYDNLNRIQSGYTTGSNWGENFTLDAWGNLTNKAAYAGKTLYESLNSSASNRNQLTGFAYDAAGNLINDGIHTYTYDDENRLVKVDAGAWNYTYDGDGRRVKKCSGTCSSSTSGTVYWDNIVDDGPAQESDLGGTYKNVYTTVHGKVIGRVDLPAKTVHYYFSDHLGSTNIVTDVNGTMSTCPTNTSLTTGEDESDFFPYGGEMQLCNRVPQNYKFTGKERDSESGLDNFGARYYTSSLGRFMTPDWAARPVTVPYAVFGDPQSLNLYGYVRNDPVSRADADGHVTNPGQEGQTACQSNPQCADSKKQQADAKAQDQSNEQTQQNQSQVSAASVGVMALPALGRALAGAEGGGEVGGAAGTVEPGGGNVVGAVVGAAAGAVVAVVAPQVYSKAKDEAGKAWTKFQTGVEHLGKLAGPDKDPRKGWKQTVHRVANEMDRHADRMQGHRGAANAIRFGADILRAMIPNDPI